MKKKNEKGNILIKKRKERKKQLLFIYKEMRIDEMN